MCRPLRHARWRAHGRRWRRKPLPPREPAACGRRRGAGGAPAKLAARRMCCTRRSYAAMRRWQGGPRGGARACGRREEEERGNGRRSKRNRRRQPWHTCRLARRPALLRQPGFLKHARTNAPPPSLTPLTHALICASLRVSRARCAVFGSGRHCARCRCAGERRRRRRLLRLGIARAHRGWPARDAAERRIERAAFRRTATAL